MSTAEQIHYYDVEETDPDKGWVHYTSRVPGWIGVDCRVADMVRDQGDVNQQTVGFMNPPITAGERPDAVTIRQLAAEAVRISRFAPEWLDRIQTRSSIRDHDLWRNEGKALYLAQRKERRSKFLKGTLVFVMPNISSN